MSIGKFRKQPWFEAVYKVGVGIKGLDGFLELAAGLLLLISPHTLHVLLGAIVNEAGHHHGHVTHCVATSIAHLDDDLARSGLTFLIIFLIGHGIVKLALVYCLLRRILWAYPYALGVLSLFLVYQLYALARDPSSVGMWLFTILDIVIIWLVWGEWKDLKESERKGRK